jgi:hypothetical protein
VNGGAGEKGDDDDRGRGWGESSGRRGEVCVRVGGAEAGWNGDEGGGGAISASVWSVWRIVSDTEAAKGDPAIGATSDAGTTVSSRSSGTEGRLGALALAGVMFSAEMSVLESTTSAGSRASS